MFVSDTEWMIFDIIGMILTSPIILVIMNVLYRNIFVWDEERWENMKFGENL